MTKEFCIETRSLNYSFGAKPVLKDISLAIPYGSIYGFLGHNGAGKTTTIKVLLSLLASEADNVFLFGKSIRKDRVPILKNVGALIEQPAIYLHLTGKENLINRAGLLGVSKTRVDEMLELVGLNKLHKIKTVEYSLGMKQRLGLALALLADPKLLILDEPTNGLDPGGILDMRNLLLDLTQNHGKTVFLSSHLLGEVEKIATEVGIVHHGRMLFQGTIESMRQNRRPKLEIEVNDVALAAARLTAHGFEIERGEGKIGLQYTDKPTVAQINQLLVNHGISVYSLRSVGQNLEELFLELTNA